MGARSVVDEERRLHQIGGRLGQSAAFLLVEVAGAELLLIHARAGANHAGEQRFARHFEREDRNRLLLAWKHRDVLGDVERQRGFAHGWPRGQDHQFAFMQAAGHFVQLEKAGAQSLDAFARVEEGIDAAVEFLEDALGTGKSVFGAGVAELQQTFLGAGQDLVGLFFADDTAVDQPLRRENDAPQNGLVLDDANIAFQVRQRGQAFVERDQVADAIDGFELVLLHQLVGDGNPVDTLAALVQLAHAQEDAAMLFQAEIVGFEHPGHLNVERVIHQDGAQNEALRVGIGREPAFERNVNSSHKKPTVLQ